MRTLTLMVVLLLLSVPLAAAPVGAAPPEPPVRACSSAIDEECGHMVCFTIGYRGPQRCRDL